MAYLTVDEINRLGFLSVGENVRISDKASIYNPGNITIGSNVRVDDFCILSAGKGGINIGSFVHLAAYSCLLGAENIKLSDFSGLSSRVSVFSSSDDYLGFGMTNPTVPEQFTRVKSSPVYLGKHVIVGAHSVLLPGASIQEGTAVGANSLVSGQLDSWSIYAGTPCVKKARRAKKIINKELQLKSMFAHINFE